MKTVKVSGAIVPNSDKWIYEWLDMEATSPNDVEKALLEANGDEVTIEINSGGGDIGAGNEIAYRISQYKGNTKADIMGYCCSAATLISCAAKIARMAPSALYMIHNVSSYAQGDYNTFSHEAGVLLTASQAISKAYQRKTGKSEQELLKLMDNETWLNSTQAKEQGFVDEIIGESDTKSQVALCNAGPVVMLDKSTMQKIRNMVKNPEGKAESDFLMRKNTAQLQLNLLKMKGEIL